MTNTWKGFFQNNNLLLNENQNLIKTCFRAQRILPGFVGKTFGIHNGKSFVKVEISSDMINKKLGEFSATRKAFSFKKK